MNRWFDIYAHYQTVNHLILAEEKNEWAIDPYAWDRNGMIELTPIERCLWEQIRLNDAVLYPQYPVLKFFVDFANPKAKVAIECDGAQYHTNKERDAERDKLLVADGWSVHRITGRECKEDYDEETGNRGSAYYFIRDICDSYGISRFSQKKKINPWDLSERKLKSGEQLTNTEVAEFRRLMIEIADLINKIDAASGDEVKELIAKFRENILRKYELELV